MLEIGLIAGAGLLVAVGVYLGWERLGAAGWGMVVLRTLGVTGLGVLLVNPSCQLEEPAGHPTVLLDASLSMGVPGGKWSLARDTAVVLAAGPENVIRFGSGTAPFDSTEPGDGASSLGQALAAALGRGTPVAVVTDGEIDDRDAVPAELLDRVGVILLPRDTAPDAALHVERSDFIVSQSDSLRLVWRAETWGIAEGVEADLSLEAGQRRLWQDRLALPAPPAVVRREATLPPGLLPPGRHLLQLRLSVPGDSVPENDRRWLFLTVTERPGIAVLVTPADWEGRFLVTELVRLSRSPVRGFALVQRDRWIDMRTQRTVDPGDVTRAARSADLLIVRGPPDLVRLRPADWWHWPSGEGEAVMEGDWYAEGTPAPSPLAGRLAGVEWDSVPPLTGVSDRSPQEDWWVALTARRGRRGAQRPFLIGDDSAGVRRMTTLGQGLWRWALRGGAAREAYRTVLAAGLDWLLAEDRAPGTSEMSATEVVPRGSPVMFTWRGAARPDSVTVTVSSDTLQIDRVLRFDPEGRARLDLDPGRYRWVAPRLTGTQGEFVVEEYSPEYQPGAITLAPRTGNLATVIRRIPARDLWWWYAVVVLFFSAEWFVRRRRGLP